MFAHLRSASWYSFRHGIAAPAWLVEQAASDGQPVLALTSRDGLHGAAEHVSACQEAGLSPGLSMDLSRGAQGWASLCHLVTAAPARSPSPANRSPKTNRFFGTGIVKVPRAQ
ncbi:PHP domain-containing protein [Nocardiopsis synnemataformans]|uniref:PHP domain-containing protein n=1 Tax=Nocardiopsis synnemataformans TaxID=61305 RepID=UPI003EBE61FF